MERESDIMATKMSNGSTKPLVVLRHRGRAGRRTAGDYAAAQWLMNVMGLERDMLWIQEADL